MMSLGMLNQCAVMVVQTLRNCWRIRSSLLNNIQGSFADVRKEHERLYQFEFGNRWAGAYRSIALKGTNTVLAAPLLMLASKA